MQFQLAVYATFAASASALAAILLLARDLLIANGTGSNASRLRRLPACAANLPETRLRRKIDHSFNRLVFETGLEISAVAGGLLVILCGLTAGSVLLLWNDDLLTAALAMIGGMCGSLLYLAITRSRRLRVIQDQLPGLLDMLARAVHAGESLEQAIELAGQKGPDPLALEFRRCSKQLEMGLSLSEVMRALAARISLMDLRILTTTLAIHRQTGGNLAVTLERMAAVVRDRLNYRRQLRATTGAARFSTMLTACAGPLLFGTMLVLQPDYIKRLLDGPIGLTLFVMAVVMQCIGLVWIVRLLRTEY